MSEHGLPSDVSRRQLLVRSAAIAAMVGPGSALAAGCAAGSGSNKSTNSSSTATNSSDPKNPFGVKASDPLEVYIFKGGYGDDYAKAFEAMYSKDFTGAQVTHHSGQDLTGDLQPPAVLDQC